MCVLVFGYTDFYEILKRRIFTKLLQQISSLKGPLWATRNSSKKYINRSITGFLTIGKRLREKYNIYNIYKSLRVKLILNLYSFRLSI